MAQIKEIIPAQYFEVIRNRIAEILTDELDNQVVLTYDADLEATVYVDRFVPFDHTDTPAVNISFAEGKYDNQTVVDVDGTYVFFIDAFTRANTTNSDRGDKLAMFKLHKLLGVCRAIIQNPIYKTLGFEPPFIMSRQISNISIAAPQKEGDALSVVMGRLILTIVAPEDTQLLTAKLIAGFDTQVKLSLTDKGYIFSGDNIPIPPVTDGKVKLNDDDFGTVAEGDTLNIPVVNTYDEELGSKIMEKWVIEDQQYKDTDNVVKSVPAGTLIICTQESPINQLTCQELNDGLTQSQRQVIQRVASIKTGQTISYATGDDADRGDGRGVDFFTLDCNNSFGNTNKQTDINGLQVYGNDYLIDHLTGLGWYLLKRVDANWATAMANALTDTTLGYDDWFIPNLRQFLSLLFLGDTGNRYPLYYEPINNFTPIISSNFWTSTTRMFNTDTAGLFILDGGSVLWVSKLNIRQVVICRKHFG